MALETATIISLFSLAITILGSITLEYDINELNHKIDQLQATINESVPQSTNPFPLEVETVSIDIPLASSHRTPSMSVPHPPFYISPDRIGEHPISWGEAGPHPDGGIRRRADGSVYYVDANGVIYDPRTMFPPTE